MKKIFSFIVLAICGVAMAQGQTVSVYSKGVALLLTPDDAGEMMFSGSTLSVGEETLDVTDIDSITYSGADFDPLRVEVAYSGAGSIVRLPLALKDSIDVEVDGAYVTITSAKLGDPEITYALSGTTTNGAFVQDGSYKCTVELNGVNITSQRGAAVHIKNGKRIDINVIDGTTNTFADYAGGTQDACFHVKGHPEFAGLGTINITGNANHAYKSGEYTKLKKTAGTINILAAANDGMHIGQYFKMNGGTLTVADGVKGDGVQVEFNNDNTKEYNGQMFLNGGTLSATISGDSCKALKADSLVFIGGGTQTVTCNGKYSRCLRAGGSIVIYNLLSTPNVTLTNNGTYAVVAGKNKKSAALKTDGDLYFHSGTLTLTADDDLKGKSAVIAGDYIYVSGAVTLKATPSIDVDGAMRVRKTEADIIAYEKTKGIVAPTAGEE